MKFAFLLLILVSLIHHQAIILIFTPLSYFSEEDLDLLEVKYNVESINGRDIKVINWRLDVEEYHYYKNVETFF